nr:hypothetical protein [Mycoplasmopsis bovis]
MQMAITLSGALLQFQVYDQWYQLFIQKYYALMWLSGGAIGYAIRGALFTFITVIFIYGSVFKNNA